MKTFKIKITKVLEMELQNETEKDAIRYARQFIDSKLGHTSIQIDGVTKYEE